MAAQSVFPTELPDVFWYRRFNGHLLACDGVQKCDRRSMQRLAGESNVRRTVGRISRDGPAARRKVHADLMRSACDGLAFDHRIARRARDHTIAGLARQAT